MSRPYFEAPTPHEAWAKVAEYVVDEPEDVHVVTRIARPAVRNHAFEEAFDALLESREDKAPTRTVASTIFPLAWARRMPDPGQLATHYREQYAAICKYPKNALGTYFGRLVELDPARGKDQLTILAEKLRYAVEKQKISSRYELNVYDFARDGIKIMDFPCMSFISVHLTGGALHMCAHYRNHYVFERLYGNFVGLGGLLAYLASHAETEVGELLVISGHAKRDGPKKVFTDLIAAARDGVEVPA